jgi:uncharacterized membrane protein YgaE (UPF0421/DUF939 family)
MTIKQMAAVQVAKLVLAMILFALLFNLGLHYFGLAVMGTVFAVAVLVYMIKFMYDIELSKLESKNALRKIKESQ